MKIARRRLIKLKLFRKLPNFKILNLFNSKIFHIIKIDIKFFKLPKSGMEHNGYDPLLYNYSLSLLTYFTELNADFYI